MRITKKGDNPMSKEENCDCGCSSCGDGCGDSCNHDTVTLSLDDGREVECVVFKIFKAGEREYIALLPNDCEEEESGEVFLYRFELTENDEPVLTNIMDDAEYEVVSEAFDELLDSMEFDEMIDDDEEE